jgi:hypothetical protein
MIVSAGALLGRSLDRYCQIKWGTSYRASNALWIASALFALSYFSSWLRTPSYNLLVNVGASVLLAGCFGWLSSRGRRLLSRQEYVSSLLVGLGGCLSFFGKPTFAAVAAIGVAFLLGRAALHDPRKAVIRTMLVAAACFVPLYLILLYTGPINAFTAAVEAGMTEIRFGNSLGQLPAKVLSDLVATSLIVPIGLFCSLTASFVPSSQPRLLKLAQGLCLLLAAIAAVLLGYTLFTDRSQIGSGTLVLVMSLLGFGVARFRIAGRTLPSLAPILVLTLVPFALAAGTANDVMEQIAASLFAFLLALTLVSRLFFSEGEGRLLEAALAAGILALFLAGAVRPYGLPRTMIRQTEPVQLGPARETLLVDSHTRRYVDLLQSAAMELGVRDDTPIFDLSGHGPGNVLLLGGRAPVFPWLVNFTEGAPLLVDAVWSRMSEDERRRAILLGPIHPGMKGSQLVASLVSDGSRYECVRVVPMDHWGDKDAVLTIWRPGTALRRGSRADPCLGRAIAGPQFAMP